MLSEKENWLNIQCMRILCKLNVIPLLYEKGTGRFLIQKRRWRIISSKLFFMLAALNWIQMAGRFLYEKRNADLNQNMDEMLVAYLIMSIPIISQYIYWFVLGKNPVETTIVLNKILSPQPEQKPTPRSGSIMTRYSLQELLLFIVTLGLEGTGLVMVIFLQTEFAKHHRLYSCLPESLKNGWTNVTLFGFDAFTMYVASAGGGIFCFMGFGFQLKFRQELEIIQREIKSLTSMEDSQNTNETLTADEKHSVVETKRRNIIRKIQELSVFIRLFNESVSFANFSSKVHCIAMLILTMFYVVRNFQSKPLAAGFSLYLGALQTFMYNVMFQRAYFISQDFEDMKRNLLRLLLLNRQENENPQLHYQQQQDVENGATAGNNRQNPRPTPNLDIDPDPKPNEGKHGVKMIQVQAQIHNSLAQQQAGNGAAKSQNQKKRSENAFQVEMEMVELKMNQRRPQQKKNQNSEAQMMKEMKEEGRRELQRLRAEQERRGREIQKRKERVDQDRGFRMQIGAIQRAAIKVGSFHNIKRACTPIFFNFAIEKLVTLLVSFPKT